MSKEMIVTATPLESRLALLEGDQVTQLFIENKHDQGILGNIYKGKVTRVLPGMQAAFVDIGLDRNAFLYVADVFDDFGEYEGIVESADESAGAIIVDEEQSEPPKKGRRRRRGRRPTRSEAEAVTEQVVVALPDWDLEILPERLSFYGVSQDLAEEEPSGGRGQILPDRFEVPVPEPSERRRRRTVSLSFDPDIHHLAAPDSPEESSGKSKEGSSQKSGQTPSRGRSRRRGSGRSKASKPPEGKQSKAAKDSAGDKDSKTRKDSRRSGGSRKGAQAKSDEVSKGSRTKRGKSQRKMKDSGNVKGTAKGSKDSNAAPTSGSSRPPSKRRRTSTRRNRNAEDGPRIGDLLKEGQEILVQIAKEPIGRKGARITSHIVLPGRYIVFMPTVDHIGVSRRIASVKERQRLRDIVTNLRGDIVRGFIVRTEGEGRSEEELRQDMIYLTRLWEQVRTEADKASAPAMIHQELDLVLRVIRDQFTDDYRALRVDDKTEYERIVEFINNFNPTLAKKVKPHRRKRPAFDEYQINSEIEKALRSKVWLKNGSHIVINQTEALVTVDVNTGKFVGKTTSLEETITRTNLEAIKEIVRQLRLRDLGGIIVIDFIDMAEAANRRKVLEALQKELDKDKAPSKMLQFNEFGLVAITRKRSRQSLQRTLCQACDYCGGDGFTHSVRTMCLSIYDDVRKLKQNLARGQQLMIRCHPDVARALKTTEKTVLSEIQNLVGRKIALRADSQLHIENFDLVEQGGDGGKARSK